MSSDPLGLTVLAPSLGGKLTCRTILKYYTFQNLYSDLRGVGGRHCPGQIIPLGITLECGQIYGIDTRGNRQVPQLPLDAPVPFPQTAFTLAISQEQILIALTPFPTPSLYLCTSREEGREVTDGTIRTSLLPPNQDLI